MQVLFSLSASRGMRLPFSASNSTRKHSRDVANADDDGGDDGDDVFGEISPPLKRSQLTIRKAYLLCALTHEI